MTGVNATLDWSALDEPRPASVEPTIWTRNLAALAEADSTLADLLGRTELPPTWRLVHALDETLTFRLEPPGQEPVWLADTAAPRTRAIALLENLRLPEQNLGLATVGTGCELALLLERLPGHLAVYVFEEELRRLAAVLRIRELAQPIAQGRCIFVPPGYEEEYALDLLRRHSGLLPPGTLLAMDQVSPARREALQRLCQRLHAEVGQHRTERIQTLAATPVQPSPTPTPRLLVVALKPDRASQVLAADLTAAAQELGWPVTCSTVSGPHAVHPLFHVERVVEFRPTLTLMLDHLTDVLPVRPSGTTYVWHSCADSVPREIPVDGTSHLAASPQVAAALRAAGASPDAVRPWYWACATEIEAASADERSASGRERPLLLVGDLPALEPQAHGVTQDTHRILWNTLVRLAAQLWPTPNILEPGKVFARAEGQCGVQIRDEVLRDTLIRLVERVIVPGVVLEAVASALVELGPRVLTLGRGWQRLRHARLRCLAADIFSLPQGERWEPRACIFAGQSDPLCPALLYAGARAWPLIVHAVGGRPLGPQLGGVLRPGEHFEPFSDLRQLRAAVQSSDSPRVQSRADRVRAHLRAHHSWGCRLKELAQSL